MHVSHVQIHSEHAIGFLKGHFQSLKGLQIRIMDQRMHHFTCGWVVACIMMHTFALMVEREHRNANGLDHDGHKAPFFGDGLSSSDESIAEPNH